MSFHTHIRLLATKLHVTSSHQCWESQQIFCCHLAWHQHSLLPFFVAGLGAPGGNSSASLLLSFAVRLPRTAGPGHSGSERCALRYERLPAKKAYPQLDCSQATSGWNFYCAQTNNLLRRSSPPPPHLEAVVSINQIWCAHCGGALH